jgi:hypothetical protein
LPPTAPPLSMRTGDRPPFSGEGWH